MSYLGRTSRIILSIGAAAVMVVPVSGCSQEVSFASMGDSELSNLLPTRAEIETTLGKMDTFNSPTAYAAPATPFPQPTDHGGLSDACFEAVFLSPEARAKIAKPTRVFQMSSYPADGPGSQMLKTWDVSELASEADARKNVDLANERLSKCDLFEKFDAGSAAVSAWVSENNGKAQASATIIRGDVAEHFSTNATSKDEAKDQAKRMIAVMAKRLEASSSKK